jgi:hypothetical protein
MSNFNFFRIMAKSNGGTTIAPPFVPQYLMVTYQFTTGQDLDTRTRIVSPDVGQDTQPEYLGWGVQRVWPSSSPYLEWGGDNTGTGFESVLLYVDSLITATGASNMTMDLRAFWYSTVGILPINVNVTLWRGGTPVKSGFVWTNPTATNTYNVASDSKLITLQTQQASTSGQRLAVLSYNLLTGSGNLNVNDTSTPSV